MSVAELEAREIQLEQPAGGLWADAWRRLRRNPAFVVGAFFVLAFVVVALFAPLLAPYSPTEQFQVNGVIQIQGPSAHHWLGLDENGYDEFSRILHGARYSLLIGVVSVAVGLSIGLLVGSIAGWFAGWVDTVIMRLMDIMLAIPQFLMALGIVALLGPGLYQIMIAIGVVNVPTFARLLRAAILSQRENDFVLAARSVGVRPRGILFSHILPNSISPVIVQGTLTLATAIIDAAGLAFLGLGDQDPGIPEWGTMLTNANRYLLNAPYLAIFPGVAIVISVLGFNLIGDSLREALDPKLRNRG